MGHSYVRLSYSLTPLNFSKLRILVAGSGSGFRLGGREVYDEDEGIEKAVAIASEADVAIVVVGLNSDWETEGHDRTTLTLPLRTDELVHRIAMANSKTIVVTQSVRGPLPSTAHFSILTIAL
jgi:hypothetical protein